MALRPVSARWFECLVAKTACSRAVEVLGRTGAIEVEVPPQSREAVNLRALAVKLDAYRGLQDRYGRYWLRGRLRHGPVVLPPGAILEHALAQISRWRVPADPLIRRIQALEEERTQRAQLCTLLQDFGDEAIDVGCLASAGPVLTVLLLVLDVRTFFDPPQEVLSLERQYGDRRSVVLLCPAEHCETVIRGIQGLDAQILQLPRGLLGDPVQALAQIAQRMQRIDADLVLLYGSLDGLYDDFELAGALGDAASLTWFVDQVGALESASVHFAWITGWTSDTGAGDAPAGESLLAELEREAVPALLHFPVAPPDVVAPQLLRNPPWARPFELFPRAFGTPSRNEVDPSAALAFIVPLLFGYMFGDVGQGLVLILAGLWLQRRWPQARLAVAGGASAMVFGLLFGSVFSREDVLPALAFHPLDQPLLTLALPIAFGAMLLVFGQLLEGLGFVWAKQGRRWLREQAGLLLAYVGVLGWALGAVGLWLAGLGALWFLVGNGPARLLLSLALLVKDGLRLLVATVSFARVGAFALAHAGLSSAVFTLADGTGSRASALLVMVVGNAVIILLEGLVVSVQTARLTLFEFFTRFLRGEGRPFRPLVPPPEIVRAHHSAP